MGMHVHYQTTLAQVLARLRRTYSQHRCSVLPPCSWLQPAQLTVQYHTKPDSDFQVTSISLYATDSGADSGKDGGKAEVEPGNAGGCTTYACTPPLMRCGIQLCEFCMQLHGWCFRVPFNAPSIAALTCVH